MRTLRLLPFLLLAIGFHEAVGAEPEAAPSRNQAFREIRDRERVSRLIEKIAGELGAKNFETALELSGEALALQSDNVEVINSQGAALVELGRYDEAREVLTRATELGPDQFAPAFNLGEIMLLEEKYSAAAGYFRSLQGRFGAVPLLKYKILLATLLAGEADAAKSQLQYIRYPGDGPAWYFSHAAIALQEGNKSEAKELISTARHIHSDDVDSYLDSLTDTKLLN